MVLRAQRIRDKIDNERTIMKYRILNIEAWAGMEEFSWEWNSWHKVGEIEKIPESDSDIIQFFVSEGFLRKDEIEKVEVDDDGHNVIIRAKDTQEPLYAIEYGNTI